MYETNNFMERKMKRDKTNTTIRTKNRKTLGRGGEEERKQEKAIEFLFLRINHFCHVSFVA